ncbi:MAG TPA: ABC transporter permease [Anaerolineales bacterium]|jgi:lipopolysaccharide transport system permease protein|nr:ABC transporter permease [Anaerolineales bacterium]
MNLPTFTSAAWSPVYLRDLLRELVARDMKLRYRRSVLGLAWTLLNPLAQLLVLNFVFSRILPLNIPNYPSFLFVGLLAWSWFQSSLINGTGAIVDNRDLIKRPGFPEAILPLVTVSANFIHFLLALPVLFLFLILARIPLSGAILALPLVFAVQFILTLSLVYLVATMHVTFRDTQYLLGVLLLLGFYLSPVFYDSSSIPAQYQTLYHLNPMAVLIDSYRQILLDGQFPEWGGILILGLVAIGLLLAGYGIFRRSSRTFAEEL